MISRRLGISLSAAALLAIGGAAWWNLTSSPAEGNLASATTPAVEKEVSAKPPLRTPTPTPETPVAFATPLPRDLDKPLPSHEAQAFKEDLLVTFGRKGVGIADEETTRKRLMALNLRGRRGVRTLLNTLSEAPKSDAEVESRLAYVDYLRYRMRWDNALPETVAGLISSPIPAKTPKRYEAALFAEKGELAGSLATVDIEKAGKLISQMKHPTLRAVATSETFHGLVEKGWDKALALAEARKITPGFTAPL